MRILFWMSVGFDRRTPSEHLLTAMVESLCAHGHQVHILQKNTGGPKALLPESLENLGVTTTAIACGMPAKSNFLARYLTDAGYVVNCRKWLKKHSDFDRVFLQSSNVAGLQTASLNRCLPSVPVVFNVQDIFPENAAYSGAVSQSGVAYKLLSLLQRQAYSYAHTIITISPDMKDQLVKLGVPEEKVAVIYNWSYQDEAYKPEQLDMASARQLLPEGYFHVVYAGNIGKMQNVDVMVDAAERLRDRQDIRFTVIGDGLYKEKLQNRAQEAGLQNLVFLPMQDSSLAPAIYATADLNVIPLAENIYKTALPSKTATCLACGKPAVFCFGGPSRFLQMVERESGVSCVSAQSVEELCDLIVEYHNNPPIGDWTVVVEKHMRKTANAERYSAIICTHEEGKRQ